MPRPRRPRCLRFRPNIMYFKPRGVPMRRLAEVVLRADEVEALKLHDVDGLAHVEAAVRMKVSQPTYGRILDRAYKKLGQAIIMGKAIRIETVEEE